MSDQYQSQSQPDENRLHVGLGINQEPHGDPLQTTRRDPSPFQIRTKVKEDDPTPIPVQSESARQRQASRSLHKARHGLANVDARLDMALQYVSQGPLANLAQERQIREIRNARRRGRAIYLNDLLQFSGKTESKNFYNTLKEWRDGQGEGGEMGEEEEGDMTILLAQARSLAQSSPYSILNSPSLLSGPYTRCKQKDSAKRQQSKKAAAIALRTSASTPEGVLGRSSLSPEVTFREVKWNEGEEEELMQSDDEIDTYESDQVDDDIKDQTCEMDVLRSGLRFILGCYDDNVKKNKESSSYESLAPPRNYVEETLDVLQTPTKQVRPRSHSIIRTLAKKRDSMTSDRNRHSSVSSSGVDSTLDVDMNSCDSVSGPSTRYGMANITPLISPSLEEGNPLNKTPSLTSKAKKEARRRSDSFSLTSPLWTRRISRLQSPSEIDEPRSQDPMVVSQLSLTSALQRVHQMDTDRHDSQAATTEQFLLNQAKESAREERVKSAALEKELETLKNSFSALERQSNGAKKLNDMESGPGSEEEATMMEAVAQAARDTAEAEVREAEWKVQCERLEDQVRIFEEALFQATAILANKEGRDDDQISWQNDQNSSSHDRTQSGNGSSRSSPPTTLTPDTPASPSNPEDVSDSGSPFYSAGEEDEDEDHKATPFASLSRNKGASFAASLDKSSQKGFALDSYSIGSLQARRNNQRDRTARRDSSPDTKTKVSGSIQDNSSPVMSTESSQYPEEEDEHVESWHAVTPSARSSTSGPASESRRDSHASWVRHSILPTRPPLPTLPLSEQEESKKPATVNSPIEDPNPSQILPSVPEKVVQADLLATKDAEIRRPSVSSGLIDYSSRAKMRSSTRSTEDNSKGLPSISTAGDLATSSPTQVNTFASLQAVPAAEEISAFSPTIVSSQIIMDLKDKASESTDTFSTRSPSLARASSIATYDSRASISETIQSSESRSTSNHSSSTGKRMSGKPVGASKLSILGHMPSTRHQSHISVGGNGSDFEVTFPSSISSPISEHYQHLLDSTKTDNTPDKAIHFSRRTRFR